MTALLRTVGEPDVGFGNLEDLAGEVANTIAGNARKFFGSEFLISVPVVVWGRPEKISFPRQLKTFVIPILWRGFRSYLLICLERSTLSGAQREGGAGLIRWVADGGTNLWNM